MANPDYRKPTWGSPPPDPNPIGKNAYRDGFHGGRWSCARILGAGYGQSDPHLGFTHMSEAVRNPGHTYDRTLPTPLPAKSGAS